MSRNCYQWTNCLLTSTFLCSLPYLVLGIFVMTTRPNPQESLYTLYLLPLYIPAVATLLYLQRDTSQRRKTFLQAEENRKKHLAAETDKRAKPSFQPRLNVQGKEKENGITTACRLSDS